MKALMATPLRPRFQHNLTGAHLWITVALRLASTTLTFITRFLERDAPS